MAISVKKRDLQYCNELSVLDHKGYLLTYLLTFRCLSLVSHINGSPGSFIRNFKKVGPDQVVPGTSLLHINSKVTFLNYHRRGCVSSLIFSV